MRVATIHGAAAFSWKALEVLVFLAECCVRMFEPVVQTDLQFSGSSTYVQWCADENYHLF